MEVADQEEHIITDDFLSWILLDLDSRGSNATAPNNPPVPVQAQPQDHAIQPLMTPVHQMQYSHPPQYGNYHGHVPTDPSQMLHLQHPLPSSHSHPQPHQPQAPTMYYQPPQAEVKGGDDDTGSVSDNKVAGQKRKGTRSRELAKESRQRQRQRVEETERRIAALKNENAELQAHLQNVTQRTTEVQRQRLDMERAMTAKLNGMSSSDSEPELEALLGKFVDLYADYGSYRQKEVAFHLSQLEKLLLPTQTTKMAIWTMQQDSQHAEAGHSPMFDILAKELDITDDQMKTLKKHRIQAISFLEQLKESMGLIKILKSAIEKKHALFDRACGRIMKEAAPQQNVKFLLWITRNAERLAKVIPDFKRSVPHVPQAPILSSPSSK